MKKLLTKTVLTLSLLGSIVLTGCGGSSSSSTNVEYNNKLEKVLGKKEIVVAISPDYAPYEFIDPLKKGQDQYVGADVEFSKFIASELGVKLTIKAMDFDLALAAPSQDQADAVISGLTYKPGRDEFMELSDSYNVDGDGVQGLLVAKSENGKYTSLDAFNSAEVKVGAQVGSLQETLVMDQIPNATIVPIKSLNDAIVMLKEGKLNAIAIASGSAELAIKNNTDLVYSDHTFNVADSGLLVGVKKGETELLDEINKIIAKVVEQGLYQQWMVDAKELAEELGEM